MDISADEFLAMLAAARKGEEDAIDRLLPLVYQELRRLAQSRMRLERAGHTLQPTAVVHEAYLRLIGGAATDVVSRAHFMALAARTIRRVLLDYADQHNADKRGGQQMRLTLGAAYAVSLSDPDVDMRDLHNALEKLKAMDARAAEVVELRYFGGLTFEELASVLEISVPTAKRDWASARLWLRRELQGTQ
jgi:RNA polymerase sigma-70 factor, ECF subfamily